MPLNPSPTELTTGATDAILGLLCLAILIRFIRMRVEDRWKRSVWTWIFGLLSLASLLGAAAHGLDVADNVQTVLWLPLYLSLGLVMALFVVGGVYDWKGARAARTLLPWAIGVGIGFFALTQLSGGAFVIFVVYEAMAMIAALAMYAALARRRGLPGASLVFAGIALSLVAAAIQASALELTAVVPFDHNGLFHLVQLAATAILANGVAAGLRQHRSNWQP